MAYVSFDALHEVSDGISHGFGPHIPTIFNILWLLFVEKFKT